MTPPGDAAMTVGPDELKEALLDKTVARVHERLPDGEAAAVADFVHQYYAQVAPEDLLERNPLDLYGAALSHWRLAQRRLPGEALVHVHTPTVEEHGWQSKHTVVAIVTDDMPFLVDSVSMALTGRGSAIHVVIHPIVHVRRDAEGRLIGLGGGETARAESFIYAEIDRLPEAAQLEELERDLHRVLADVRAAVEDWRPMRARALALADELDADSPPIDPEELEEAKALLRWIEDHHLTFLGYREYELRREDGEDVLRTVPGSGLGILREKEAKPISRSFAELPVEVRRLARERNILNLTKANSRATVHRPSYLDYIGVKKLDEEGNPVGERRFLGLYTHTAYLASPWEIPVVRHKIRRVIDRAGFPPDSHDEKALVEILWTYPRDELFQISEDELYDTALGILHLGERRRVRLFVRRDTFGRFLSCLVFLPRDRYDTRTRRKIERILCEAFGGSNVDYNARLSESVLARLHYIIYTPGGAAVTFDVREIEARLAEAARTWSDDLNAALVDQLGEGRGSRLARRYADAFPLAYQQDVAAPAAVADVNRIEQLDEAGDLGMSLYVPLESAGGLLRFKVLRAGQPIVLSDVLPLLENMGVRVVDERPYEVRPAGGPPVWIYDFGLQHGDDEDLAPDRLRQDFQDVFGRVFRGEDENDGFNRLVLRAGLNWLQIRLLRAIAKYLRQAGSTFSQTYMEESLAANPEIAQRLLEVFRLRFDPARPIDADAKASAAVHEIETALDAVQSLDEDRILRSFLRVLQAMLRTNAYQRGPGGESKEYLSFKLDPAQIPDLPAPRPAFEIFVYSPRTEGIHLRGGAVARGGIRWSDRREDFRTEILGLMKAQQVKNTVIVPNGAKGGFVCKALPTGDRDAVQREVVSCYQTFIRGLLDVTDNIVDGHVVPPQRVIRKDDDDPYLVVAADKGTATFSDIANALSAEYSHWLGDAFASGGSAGYDHKKMAITARGAWEAVKRHFRELGVDPMTQDFTVAGIGDMSGDVFGNGMLLSPHLKLVAAFDHRHIFVDPNP
ncbi:MAG TPA: NAD-glutamate dehydrogenase domain-containing protein, partial [Gaiellaceae bacterium]